MKSPQKYREVSAFLGLAECLNFTIASGVLGISQPTLSRLIARLEDQTGSKLFTRSTRRVSLTTEGEALYRELKGIDGRIARALDIAADVSKGKRGEVRVTYNSIPINTMLAPMLHAFHQEQEMVQIRLMSQTSTMQLESLAAGGVDIAFGSVATNKEIFQSKLISQQRIVAVLNRSDPLAQKESLVADDLRGRSLILGNPASWQSFNPAVDAFLVRHELDRNLIFRAEDYESISAMTTVGFGIGFFVEVPDTLARKHIITRPIADLDATVPVLMIWRNNLSNPAALKLIDFSAQWLGTGGVSCV